MPKVQVLSVGSNPNLAFYMWRLQEANSCDISVVNSEVTGKFEIESQVLGDGVFSGNVYRELSMIPKSSQFEIVFLSCDSLQDFQTIGSKIAPYLHKEAAVVIESTGYVNLEPFMQMSLSNMKKLTFSSIMSENDVRQLGNGKFLHVQRNNDSRLYFGTCTNYSSKTVSPSFQRVYKLLQEVQQSAADSITLLKSTKPKEFMTYQWKLALPRIAFSPLCVFFELPFPEMLSKQILCKPLITGIIGEIFKIIKKMDCKLVKGSENEANLMSSWSRSYPEITNNQDFLNSPLLFYQFYHLQPLCIDLLLLQPILLADDHGIRTPYLENLYSVICQLSRVNYGESKSVFFKGARGEARSTEEIEKYKNLSSKIDSLKRDMESLGSKNAEASMVLKERESTKAQVDEMISQQQIALNNLSVTVQREQQRLSDMKQEEMILLERVERLRLEDSRLENEQAQVPKNPVNNHKQAVTATPNRDSVVPVDNLEDLAAIAVYGSQIANDPTSPEINGIQASVPGDLPQNNDITSSTGAKTYNYDPAETSGSYSEAASNYPPEKEIYSQQSQKYPSINGSNAMGNGPEQNMNGSLPSPLDQQPPHGLPPSGMPAGSFPYNLRNNQSGSYQNPGRVNGNHVNAPMPVQSSYGPGSNNYGPNNYGPSNYGPNNYGPNNYGPNNYGPNNYGPNNYGSNGYAPNGYGSMPHDQNAYNSNSYGPPKHAHRVQSFSGSLNAFYDAQAQGGQYSNSQSYQFGLDQSTDPRTRGPKKSNRRSNANALTNDFAFDMGGRGGMPMPSVPGNSRVRNSPATPRLNNGGSRKSVAVLNGVQPNGALNTSPSQPSQGWNPPQNSAAANSMSQPYLNIPDQGANSSGASSNSNDTPQTNEENQNISLEVPNVDSVAKPLGSIANSNSGSKETTQKKKRGIFRKK